MSVLSLDVAMYLPFLFVATLLIGLKLDGIGSMARAPWMLVMITLVLYIPVSLSYYVSRWITNQHEPSDKDEQDDAFYGKTNGGVRYTGNSRLPPFVYSRDKVTTTLSLLLWAYCTVVPWATLPIKSPSSGLNGLYYTLLAILLVTLLLLFLESLFWIVGYERYGEGIPGSGISERFVLMVTAVRDGIIKEVNHDDEMVGSLKASYSRNTKETPTVLGSGDRSKNKKVRSNGIQVIIPDSMVPPTTVSIPSALNVDFAMEEGEDGNDNPGDEHEDDDKQIPDMEDYEVDTNLVVNQRYVNGTSVTGRQPKGRKGKSGNEVRVSSIALGALRSVDKGKQTRLVVLTSLIVAICFVFPGISRVDSTYYKLAFVVSGSIFLFLLLMVLVQRRFKPRLWVIGFLLASASYITLTLMIYNAAPGLAWSTALIPVMLLEAFLFVINITVLWTK